MINCSILLLVWRFSDYVDFRWCVGSGGRKQSWGEDLDNCLTLSTLLMDSKLDCQRLRGCLNEQFFVDDALTTKVMSQNHLKIEHLEIGSRCHGYQNVRTRCHLRAATFNEAYFMSIHCLWSFWVYLGCNIDNLWLLEPISGQKTKVTKTQKLYSCLRFCGNIMCTAGPNKNLWLTKATRMDIYGYDMPNDSNFALYFGQWGCCGSAWGGMKNWRFCSYGNFGDKNHRFHLPAGYPGMR